MNRVNGVWRYRGLGELSKVAVRRKVMINAGFNPKLYCSQMAEHSSLERYIKYRDEVIVPLMEQRRFREICDLLIAKLDVETDPEFRFELFSLLIVHLSQIDDEAGCKHWARVLTEEFDHKPYAWTTMARSGVGSPKRHNTREEDLEALRYYEIALDRAYKSNQWVRDVLFYICRHLCHLKDYEQHEFYMRRIIDDLDKARELDIPFLEDDWLERVPEGKMDEDLRRTYQAYVVADKSRCREASELSVPTRKQLDMFL